MLRRPHGHHRDLRAPAPTPRTTRSRLPIRDTAVVTRHGLAATASAAPMLAEPAWPAPIAVRDAVTPSRARLPAPVNPRSPSKSRPSTFRSALASVVPPDTGPAQTRNPHRSVLVARGFGPPRLSYACRRPKVFRKPERPLSGTARSCQAARSWPRAGPAPQHDLEDTERTGPSAPSARQPARVFEPIDARHP